MKNNRGLELLGTVVTVIVFVEKSRKDKEVYHGKY